jgi:heavy metal sensor kinase
MLRSIKGRLLLWVFCSVTALFCAFGWALHLKLHYVVEDSIDKMLHASLQLVKGLVHTHDGKTIQCESNEFIHGDYVLPDSGHYYKVFVDGDLVGYSFSLVDKEFDLTPGDPLFHNAKAQEWVYHTEGPNSEPLRVIRHDFVYLEKQVRIVVAEDMTESMNMIHRLANFFLVVMPLVIFIIGMISFVIASCSLRPLWDFSDTLEKISHKNLEERIEPDRQAVELRRLAEKFNALLERLRQAFEAERNLLGNAAHELKTPLAVIRAECDIALRKTRSAEEHQESLQEIRSVSETMLAQVNGLLTLARLDSGMLDASALQPVSLEDCVADAARLAEPLAKKKNVLLNISLNGGGLMVAGDKETLTEAVLNVIENAVKYNHPGGFVAVELHRREDQAEIVISDTGVGISEEDKARIFDRFWRAASVRSTEGSGLGLSIVKAVMQAHQGEIRAEAQNGGGSRFVLSLPLAAANAPLIRR